VRLSSRFAAAIAVLLGAAAALRIGVLSEARGPDRCAAPGALKATSLIPGSTALGERLDAVGGPVLQWSEGEVAHPLFARLPMQFQVIRSFDARSLYDAPVRLAERAGRPAEPASERSEARLQPETLSVRDAEVDGVRVPVHVAWDHTDEAVSRLVAWLFVFDNAPVESPLAAQLRGALGLALGGPRPLTLVTLSTVAPSGDTARVEEAAMAWFADAWRYVARSCGPP
jgi:hypothetical protein